jgi:ectoine hydroxylase
MNTNCFDYCLTDEERESFDRDGFLIVKEALTERDRTRLLSAVEALHTAQSGKSVRDVETLPDKLGLFSNTGFMASDPAFTDLMDWPKVLPKLWGVLGWNIYLYHAHCDVTPPASAEHISDNDYRAWHQDSMRVNDELEYHPRPRLSVKVAFVLSDMSQPGRGNMLICPGSHLKDTLDVPDGACDPAGAIPLCAEPGDTVIFDRRLWHSRSLNLSDITRKIVFLGFAYRWLRPKDNLNLDALRGVANGVRAQLCGFDEDPNSYYDPGAGEVPLKEYLEENGKSHTARDHHGGAMGMKPR